MDPNTLMYGLITSGEDGSYIANNYVSRDFLPDVKMWPWAYGTLSMIFNHCDIDIPFTLEGQMMVDDLALTLDNSWREIINDFESGSNRNHSESFVFDPLAESKQTMAKILVNQNPNQIMFAQKIQSRFAKLLHQTLDDETLAKSQKFSLIKTLLEEASKHISCNFDNMLNNSVKSYCENESTEFLNKAKLDLEVSTRPIIADCFSQKLI